METCQMNDDVGGGNEFIELPKCFNCHSKLEIIDEEVPGASPSPGSAMMRHGGGIIINHEGHECALINYSEALTHIFELDSGGIEEVELLNVNDMTLCDCCYEILANIYSLRQNFQDLTDAYSCIFKLINKSQSQTSNEEEVQAPKDYASYENDESQLMDTDEVEQVSMNGEEDLDLEISEEGGVSSKSISENQLSKNETGTAARACLMDPLPSSSANEIGHEQLLRCPWCSKHVKKSVHKLHVDQCYNAGSRLPSLGLGSRSSQAQFQLAAQIHQKLARSKSQQNVSAQMQIRTLRWKADQRALALKSRPPRSAEDSRKWGTKRCRYCAEEIWAPGCTTQRALKRAREHTKQCKYNSPEKYPKIVDNPVTCPICENPRIPEKRLRRHVRTHGSEEEKDILLPAKICCEETYTSRSDLKVHQKSAAHQRKLKEARPPPMHPPRKVVCPLECGKTMTAAYLKQHIKEIHERKLKSKVFCDICARPCDSPHRLKLHRFSHLSEAEKMALPPEDLQIWEKDQASLAMYARRKHEKKISNRRIAEPTKCPECPKVLSNSYKLQTHIDLVHRCKSKHICDICGRPTVSEQALKRHRTTHFGAEEKLSMVGSEIKSLCPNCGASFKSGGSLRLHIARIHEKSGPTRPTHTCDKCGYKVQSKKNFNIHMRAHEEEDVYSFPCEKCPMKFKFKGERLQHRPSCPGEAALRPFSCIVEGCDRRFKYRCSLELHTNEFHEYGPEKAREMLYPEGLPKRFKENPKPVGKKWRTKKRTQKSQSQDS